MMMLQRRQWVVTLAIILLYSPVFLSVSVPAITRIWSGLGYMIFVIVLMFVFVAMAWALVRMDFVERADPEAGS